MFKMTIEGSSLADLGAKLGLAAQQFGTTMPEGNAASAKATRKKVEPAATATEADTSTPSPTSAPASAPSEPATVDKGKLQKDCMALSNKSGSTALAELFGEFGAAKWSEITEDKYPALQARLEQLLAPAE